MRLVHTALAAACWMVPAGAFAQPVTPPPAEPVAPSSKAATEPADTPSQPVEATQGVAPEVEPEPAIEAPPAAAEPALTTADEKTVSEDVAELRRELEALKEELRASKDDTAGTDDGGGEYELGRFSEDGGKKSPWRFEFHGYARMPLRFTPGLRRAPYLVDDDYYLSGFSYLRVQEREWAELFFEARQRNTRLVFGLFASQFSDWSEATLQGQGGLATAFVEQHAEPVKWLELDARVGMFWDRYGYVEPYDTYLHGRTHIAGGRVATRWADYVTARFGVGGHAEVIGNNQGFTPVVYGTLGFDTMRHKSARHAWVSAGFFGARTWTRDSDREFAQDIKNADLRVYGGEASLHVERAGKLQFTGSFMDAKRVLSLANSLEILHSTGGRGLSQNFFGSVEDGTGQAIMTGLDLLLEPYRMLPKGVDWRKYITGLNLRVFGMLASIQSKEGNTNPALNRDDRNYLKWGTELTFRPNGTPLDFMFASYRFDRVILDTNHQSLTFRAHTPRVGFIILETVRIFGAYSQYDYGDAITLRPNQIPGDNNRTQPDEHVFKLQAEARW